ncbi:hypothetical protein O181_076102 [Austropuccinia psidii MF-1]|uniref:Uncharacterized protein n=1 Tax=Austropuccinia psidii MF-1 TaxID=1389203 RepID=A0A9Q3FG89_9BASI|nr:hypothetical protein [Austropuccinia psidii MF-1]
MEAKLGAFRTFIFVLGSTIFSCVLAPDQEYEALLPLKKRKYTIEAPRISPSSHPIHHHNNQNIGPETKWENLNIQLGREAYATDINGFHKGLSISEGCKAQVDSEEDKLEWQKVELTLAPGERFGNGISQVPKKKRYAKGKKDVNLSHPSAKNPCFQKTRGVGTFEDGHVSASKARQQPQPFSSSPSAEIPKAEPPSRELNDDKILYAGQASSIPGYKWHTHSLKPAKLHGFVGANQRGGSSKGELSQGVSQVNSFEKERNANYVNFVDVTRKLEAETNKAGSGDTVRLLENNKLESHAVNNEFGNVDKKMFVLSLVPLLHIHETVSVKETFAEAFYNSFGFQSSATTGDKHRAVCNIQRSSSLIEAVVTLNKRVLLYLQRRQVSETWKSEEIQLHEFLEDMPNKMRKMTSESKHLQKIKRFIIYYFETEKNKALWESNSSYSHRCVVSEFEIGKVNSALLILAYYYKTTNKEKWDYLFKEEARFLGLFAKMKSYMERNHMGTRARKLLDTLGTVEIFPWVNIWSKVPQEKVPKTEIPTLAEWAQGEDHLKLQILKPVTEIFLTNENPLVYTFIETVLKEAQNSPPGEIQMDISEKAGELKSLWLNSLSHVATNGEKKLNTEFLSKSVSIKIDVLMERVVRLAYSFTNRFTSEVPVIKYELESVLNWVIEHLSDLMKSKKVSDSRETDNEGSFSSGQSLSQLFSEILKETETENFKANRISGSFSADGDKIITRLALCIVADYYYLRNYDKWKALFSARSDALTLLDLLALCLKHKLWPATLTEVSLAKYDPKLPDQIIPWKKEWPYPKIPQPLILYKLRSKKVCMILQRKLLKEMNSTKKKTRKKDESNSRRSSINSRVT